MISKQVTTGPWTPCGLLCFSLRCRRGGKEETREKGRVGAKDELTRSTSAGTVTSPTPPPKLWDNIKTQTLSVQVSVPSSASALPVPLHACMHAGRQAGASCESGPQCAQLSRRASSLNPAGRRPGRPSEKASPTGFRDPGIPYVRKQAYLQSSV